MKNSLKRCSIRLTRTETGDVESSFEGTLSQCLRVLSVEELQNFFLKDFEQFSSVYSAFDALNAAIQDLLQSVSKVDCRAMMSPYPTVCPLMHIPDRRIRSQMASPSTGLASSSQRYSSQSRDSHSMY